MPMSKQEIQEMLVGMGFEPNYIGRAFKVYEKNYGHTYNVEVITEIIVRLQVKDRSKKQKQQQQAGGGGGNNNNNKSSPSKPVIANGNVAAASAMKNASQPMPKPAPAQPQPSPNMHINNGNNNMPRNSKPRQPMPAQQQPAIPVAQPIRSQYNSNMNGGQRRPPQQQPPPIQNQANTRFSDNEIVLYQGQDAQVMRIHNAQQIEVSFPANVPPHQRNKAIVHPNQLMKRMNNPQPRNSQKKPQQPPAQRKPPKQSSATNVPKEDKPKEEINMPPFVAHMSTEDARKLKIHDKIDHRDQVGRFVFATVSEKQGTNLKIHYDGWSRKWDTWSDYSSELHRFAYPGSISQRPAHRFSSLKKSDYVDINPSQRHAGWKVGEIRRLDQKSGQVQVVYGYQDKNYLYWAHLDNLDEIAEFPTKSGEVNNDQVELMSQQRASMQPNNANHAAAMQNAAQGARKAQGQGQGQQDNMEDQIEAWARIRAKRYPKYANEKIDNKLDIGEWLEVQDSETLQWITATVIDKENNWILVHFDGWPSKYDQKLHVIRQGKLLRPLGVAIPETQEEKDIKVEMEGFLKEVQDMNWELSEVDADGNCLYRCFAISIYNDTTKHKQVRAECMQYMRENQTFFSHFIPDFEQRMKEKEQEYEWGDHVDINALSELYNVRVRVFEYAMDTKKLYVSFDLGEHSETLGLPLILLARHRKKHYNIITDPKAVHKRPLGCGDQRVIKNKDGEVVSLRAIRLSEDAKQEHKEGGDDGEDDAKDGHVDEDDEQGPGGDQGGVDNENARDKLKKFMKKKKKKLESIHSVLSLDEKEFEDILQMCALVEPLDNTDLKDIFDVLVKHVHQRMMKAYETSWKDVVEMEVLKRFWEQQFGTPEQRTNNRKRWSHAMKEKVPSGKYPATVALLTFNQKIVGSVSDNLNSIVMSSRKRQSTIDVSRQQSVKASKVEVK